MSKRHNLEKLFDRDEINESDIEMAIESLDDIPANLKPSPYYRRPNRDQDNNSSVRSDNLILFDQGNDQDNMVNYLSTRSFDAFQQKPPQLGVTSPQEEPKKPKVYLNTWSGVYIPCIHACIGITVFLRMPWIVGNSGVAMTLVYLLISQFLIVLTCTSVAAIASNGLFSSIGGPYYMISRSLGKEIGVSVGIILWFSLCISSTIYISGASLILAVLFPVISFPDVAWNTHIYGSVLLLLLTTTQILNKQRLYYINMGLFTFVILAILFLFIGIFSSTPRDSGIKPLPGILPENMNPNYDYYSPEYLLSSPFMYFFTIFFPSVSGIIPGLNRSGSLKSPAQSLKVGLFSSILTISVIYSVLIILLGCVVEGDLLRAQYTNKLVTALIAWPGDSVILVFIFFIALGAAIYCFSGANSILASMSNDDILPVLGFLNSKNDHTKRYWRVIIITMCVALFILQISNFELLSKAASLANLLTFCFLNWSTALLGFLKSPGWRPTFRYYHWSVSFIGGILSLFLMFAFDWRIALGAIFAMSLVIGYVQYYGAVVDWGDALFALNLQISQQNLVRLEKYEVPNSKNWRPQMIGFSTVNTDDNSLPIILSFLSQLKKGRGLTILLSVIITQDLNMVYQSKENEKLQVLLKTKMEEYDINGFAEVLVSRSLVDGIAHAVQLAGLGKLSPNTVVMGYITKRDSLDKCEQYVEAIKAVLICKKGLILIKSMLEFPSVANVQSGYIDIYWIRHDGGMLSILPHLLKKHNIWRKCKLRIFALAELTDNSVEIGKQLKDALIELRIEAYSEVIEIGDSDISEFTYEKTMQLQERQEYLKKLRNDMGSQRKNSLHLFIRDDQSKMISPYLKQHKL
eukprot:NODE_88_length_21932_cov_0.317867.p1 type:complete len:860 gc:universal NODE_88_length_21932_cov_0.317867:12169-9590(-)